MKTITYLITGSSGSIGGCIYKHLTAKNCCVVPLFRDISNNYLVDSSCILSAQDIVLLHFGAATYANTNNENIKLITQNHIQLKNLISSLNSCNVIPRVVLASSTSVYNADKVPELITENSTLTESDVYGLSKLNCELLLGSLYDTGLISSYVLLRLPGVLAPDSWKTSRNFLSVLIHDIAHNNYIKLHSPSALFNNLTDPCLIIKFIDHLIAQPELPSIPLNLGGKNAVVISELLNHILLKFKFKGTIEWLTNIPKSFTIDIGLATKYGFISETPLETIDRFISSEYNK